MELSQNSLLLLFDTTLGHTKHILRSFLRHLFFSGSGKVGKVEHFPKKLQL